MWEAKLWLQWWEPIPHHQPEKAFHFFLDFQQGWTTSLWLWPTCSTLFQLSRTAILPIRLPTVRDEGCSALGVGQHAPIYVNAWGLQIFDHGILPWSSFEAVAQLLVPSAESSLSVRLYLISQTVTFVCYIISEPLNFHCNNFLLQKYFV